MRPALIFSLLARGIALAEPGLPTARWSDPATWGGSVPVAGDSPIIPSGAEILLDVVTPAFVNVTVAGRLVADPAVPVGMTMSSLELMPTGTLEIGSATNRRPQSRKAIFTFTGTKQAGTARFIPQVDGAFPDANGTRAESLYAISRLAVGTGGLVAGEVITLTFTSATTFTALSSTAGAMPSGTVGTYYNNRAQFKPLPKRTGSWTAGEVVTISAGTQLGFSNVTNNRRFLKQPGAKFKCYGEVKTGTMPLGAHMAAGTNTMTLESAPVGWLIGDELTIGPTDFYGTPSGTPQDVTITGVSGAVVTFTPALIAARWGLLQYPTDTGLSLTPGAFTEAGMKAGPLVPTVIDERARIINKSRAIVFEGANDATYNTDKWGLDMMVMGLAGEVVADGIEVRRGGKAGFIGRYAFHWHMLSYGGQEGGNMALPSDGTFLGSATGQKIVNSSIHNSVQRGVVIHGTHGVEVGECVFANTRGHTIFLEDNVEQDNIIRANTLMHINTPEVADKLLLTDGYLFGGDGAHAARDADMPVSGVAGIWLSHPKNTLINNYVAGSQDNGIWNAFTYCGIGLCVAVDTVPLHVPLTEQDGNTGACCGMFGISSRAGSNDSRGTLGGNYYLGNMPTVASNFMRATLIRNRRGAYHNQVQKANYEGWTLISNQGPGLSGVAGGVFKNSLAIGESLHVGTPITELAPFGRRVVQVSYGLGLMPFNVSVYGYPEVPGTALVGNDMTLGGGGVVRMNDHYVHPVNYKMAEVTFEAGVLKCFGTSGAGWITPPNYERGVTTVDGTTYMTLSGAILDTKGWWANPGDTLMHNDPFFTSGQTVHALQRAASGNFVATTSTMMGVSNIVGSAVGEDGVNKVSNRQRTIVDRLASDRSTIIGTFNIPERLESQVSYQNLKHFVMAQGGIYRVVYDALALTPKVNFNITNAFRATDTAIIGVQIAGATVRASLVQTPYYAFTDFDTALAGWAHPVEFSGVGSWAALLASSVRTFWHETATNTVWIKHVGWGGTPNNANHDNLVLPGSYYVQGYP